MSKETLELIQRKTGMVYSDEQAALIDSKGGACVLACAGSGKTTALTHMIARRLIDKEITSGRRILGVTFSKTGATEMDERLEELLDLLDIPASVKMKTLHAFCLEFLKNIGAMQGRAVIPEYEKLDVIQKIGRTQTRNWKYEDAEVIAGLITLQRGSLRSRENFLNSTDFRISGIESLKYVTVYDGYTKYKAENNVIDFDDMLLLAHLKLKQSPFYGEKFMDTYQCILVDEAQDMSKLQYKIVLQLLGSDAVTPAEHEDHVRKTLVLIGDDDQCQPAGTKITMQDGSIKLIEDLKVGDKVLAYNRKEAYFPKTGKHGKEVTAISEREVDSLLEIRTADGHTTRYTDNHKCFAKVHYEGNEDKYVVYLMRNKDGWYRVGHTKLFVHSETLASFGVGNRLRSEKGTDAWILKVVDTASEAWLIEQECAYIYGIPQTTWMSDRVKLCTPEALEELYQKLGDLTHKATECLKAFGRDINYPLLSRSENKKTHLSFSRAGFTEVYACNLIPECMDMAIPFKTESGEWKIKYSQLKEVKRIQGSFTVYGMNVADYHNYIGDGILTHNCIYEWMGSEPQELAKVKDAYRLPLYTLSTNYRCPANVLSAAARCISNNTHSIPKSMDAHKPDGVLRYDRVRGGGFAAESKYVADCIAKQLDAGVAPSSIAVLARNAAHLSLVWLYLSCYGIKSRLYGGNSSGPDSLIKHIGECFRLYQSSVDAGNVLYALFGGNKQSSEKLATLINMVDGTFMEWLEYIVATYIPGYKDVMSEDNAYANAGKMWKNSMKEYYTSGGLSRKSNSMQNLLRLYNAGKTSEVAFYQEVLDIYKDMMDWKFKSDDSIRIFLGTISAIKDLLDRYAEKAIPVLTTIGRHRAPNKHFVTLSTAHSAKGREWNTVYIVCDDIYAFPSQVSIDILSSMGDPKAVKNFIEAERRLHYVAMTRARETLHIVGGDIPPGMFLQEALSDEDALRNGFDSSDIGTDVTVDFKFSETDYSKMKYRESVVRNDRDEALSEAEDDEDLPSVRDYSMHDLDI